MENNLIGKLFSDDIKDIKEAIDSGVNVNIKNKEGKTALIEQSFFGNFNNVKFLLDSGADVNIVDNEKNSPLHYAGDNVDISKLLIEYGVKIENNS